jgi:hypothetical protein
VRDLVEGAAIAAQIRSAEIIGENEDEVGSGWGLAGSAAPDATTEIRASRQNKSLFMEAR